MPPWSLLRSLTDLLDRFRCCFTAPTFTTFTWLVAGFCARPVTRTVIGMLTGARLAFEHACPDRPDRDGPTMPMLTP
jgi:hypothetical protein